MGDASRRAGCSTLAILIDARKTAELRPLFEPPPLEEIAALTTLVVSGGPLILAESALRAQGAHSDAFRERSFRIAYRAEKVTR